MRSRGFRRTRASARRSNTRRESADARRRDSSTPSCGDSSGTHPMPRRSRGSSRMRPKMSNASCRRNCTCAGRRNLEGNEPGNSPKSCSFPPPRRPGGEARSQACPIRSGSRTPWRSSKPQRGNSPPENTISRTHPRSWRPPSWTLAQGRQSLISAQHPGESPSQSPKDSKARED